MEKTTVTIRNPKAMHTAAFRVPGSTGVRRLTFGPRCDTSHDLYPAEIEGFRAYLASPTGQLTGLSEVTP